MPSFLDMPPELRLQIYSYVAEDTGTIMATKSHTSDLLTPLALLQTCGTIRKEYTPIVLKKVTFHFKPWLGYATGRAILKTSPLDLGILPAPCQLQIQRMQLELCRDSLHLFKFPNTAIRAGWIKEKTLVKWLAKFRSLRHLTIYLTGIDGFSDDMSLTFLFRLKTPAILDIVTAKPAVETPLPKYLVIQSSRYAVDPAEYKDL
ncbi:MAG: hypothetical protein M1821_002387 [Bathelium mastoideum]|nr:MAG: hypothetical protein M1821_002387 [Bathelium mastoideum]KAI9686403.1 MAG: hypothetical protein M1822_003748 [Bathelium mastoideum]